MNRPSISIVIPVWNAWETTRACLDSLGPTLQVGDQVIVVDNGSRDTTPERLPDYGWIQIVTNPENLGFAGGCNAGAAVAEHEILVILNNDTLLANGWLEELVAPFGDPDIAAIGPRSNFVSGPQLVQVPYTEDDVESMPAFAEKWRAEHSGQTSPATRLVGFCLAVRRDEFENAGGFFEGYGIGGFEDDDLCMHLVASGRKLVIADGSFVHHEGHKTFDDNGLNWFGVQTSNERTYIDRAQKVMDSLDFPLLSACLIVRDEQETIGPCLDSIRNLVDETIVYDTGSTDRTVEIARSRGATVIEGFWDDDFSRARNAALEHAKGMWILWIDADETAQVTDARALRLRLVLPGADAFGVSIENLMGNGTSPPVVHVAHRLFRREVCKWAGKIHELVVQRDSNGTLQSFHMPLIRIRHIGYLDSIFAERHKAERNVRLSKLEVGEPSDVGDPGFSMSGLARSLWAGGQLDDALQVAQQAAILATSSTTRRTALKTGAEVAIVMRETDTAQELIDRLRANCESQVLPDYLEGLLRLAQERYEEALIAVSKVGSKSVDDDGFEYGTAQIAGPAAESLFKLGRYPEAASLLLAGLTETGTLGRSLEFALDCMERAGLGVSELLNAIPPDAAVAYLAESIILDPESADRFIEAALSAWPGELAVLAAAIRVLPNLSPDRTAVWSTRLRKAGLAEYCE